MDLTMFLRPEFLIFAALGAISFAFPKYASPLIFVGLGFLTLFGFRGGFY